MSNMYYVYILRSKKHKCKTYIGITRNLINRLTAHNLNIEIHTRRYAPWEIESYVAVKDKAKAFKLEKYFKSSSGKAFLNKRLFI